MSAGKAFRFEPRFKLKITGNHQPARGPELWPVVQLASDRIPYAGAIVPRIVCESYIRSGYATDPIYLQDLSAIDVITAGAKRLHLYSGPPEHAVDGEALIAALRSFLVVVDPVLIHGHQIAIGDLGFPALAFEQFLESLLFRAVIVTARGPADAAVEIEGRAFFLPTDVDGELLAAFLAAEHHEIFTLLDRHYRDPVWTLLQQHTWPGRARCFLDGVRRSGARVKGDRT